MIKFILLLLVSLNIHAELLDKTIAIYGDKIITLSQVKRIKSNLVARNKISKVIYHNTKLSIKNITEILIQRFLIRDRLKTIGYIISDEQVESQIKSTEKNLGVDRQALLNFLKNYNLSFDEYFILIRQSIEFNLFVDKVIRPLVSISEQEIKETYYKSIKKRSGTKSYLYHLIDFYIDKRLIAKSKYKKLIPDLIKFQQNGSWPSYLKKMETNVLQDVEEDALSYKIKNAVRKTHLHNFTKPITLNKQIHIFYLKNKKLTDSGDYLDKKLSIKNKIFELKVNKLSENWFNKERQKYFIKTYY